MRDKNFKVIIPVAGIGKRLRPHTYTIPKPLIPVAGKPIISHILDPLTKLEPEEVVFVIGHLGEQIVDFVRENYQFKSKFVRQNELLGLGFAINLALNEMTPGPTLIILGDTIAKMDYERFIGGGSTIGLKKVADPKRFGVAVIKDDNILAFVEKPQEWVSDMAVIGVYYFEDSSRLKSQLDRLIETGKKTSGEIQLTDAMDFMIKEGERFGPFMVDGWFDCGEKQTLLETNRLLLPKTDAVENYPGCQIKPPVFISPTAEIKNSTIGPYVSISGGARVNDSIVCDSIIGRNAFIENCEFDFSVIGENTKVTGKKGQFDLADSSESDQTQKK